MMKLWNNISWLGLKDTELAYVRRDVVLANRLNLVIFFIMIVLTIVTTIIRELQQSEFTLHTQKLLLLAVACGFNFVFSHQRLFLLAKLNLIFSSLFLIILLPVFTSHIQDMDFIYGPIIITSLSLLPQLLLEPKSEKFLYWFSLCVFLIVVVLYDNMLVYFSHTQLSIVDMSHSFHSYYKSVFIASFVFFHASMIYLREIAFKYENQLSVSNKILLQQKEEIFEKNEELKQQQEEIFAQSKELETINKHLEERVIEELSKNRKKDVLLIQQSRQAAMGEMIGNIAHQWRQPLSAVAVIVQNIQEAYNYKELTREYMEDKVKQCMGLIDYMSQTIDDFRNFFKPEKSTSLFDVKAAVMKSISFVRDPLKANNIELVFHAAEDILVKGYSNEYSQVVLNLISNAQDVLVERRIENPKIEITLFQKDKKSYLFVSDNAGGIAPQIKDKIFTPYITTKSQGIGTGIGLYMSKTIIEKNMGGSLTFVDVEGGTEFCVVL